MKISHLPLQAAVMAVAATCMAAAGSAKPPAEPAWRVVVNNGFAIPRNSGKPVRYYNSYNPPSVNAQALVVFRARSTGQSQGPVSGIYTRDMAVENAGIRRFADRDTTVPWPNNTYYPLPGGGGGGPPDTTLSSFNEFPSFPRIAINADAVATRGNHQPVWTYEVETVQLAAAHHAVAVAGVEDEEETTRAGTTGVYVNLDANEAASPLFTGASQLGAVAEFSAIFRVPGVGPVTRFDVFPGAPAITDAGVIAFKGNYTDGGGKTGVFYRQVYAPMYPEDPGGPAAIQLTANSDTEVPNPGACSDGTTFGSTAPPSAAGDHMVFVGFDNEQQPTCGGIYRAPLYPPAEQLETLVGLERDVPGQGGATFTRLGEGLSYDGRFVGFWGAWGSESKTLRLYCPQEGNRARRFFCNKAEDPQTGEIPGGGEGDINSVCNDATDPMHPVCYQEKQVPVNQGIFVYDTVNGKLWTVAMAGADFDDFVYWNYSGAPPGAGESEGNAEPPRWRSSAFLAVDQRAGATFRVAFLARNGELDNLGRYVDPVDGIHLARVLGASQQRLTTLLETGMDGTVLDPDAVDDGTLLPITSLALERDAMRNGWLAITASMGTEEAGWAGIYLTKVP